MGDSTAFDTTPAPILAATQVPGKQKKLIVKRQNPQFALYAIFYEGGGEVPDELKGTFTSLDRAKEKIDTYIKAA